MFPIFKILNRGKSRFLSALFYRLNRTYRLLPILPTTILTFFKIHQKLRLCKVFKVVVRNLKNINRNNQMLPAARISVIKRIQRIVVNNQKCAHFRTSGIIVQSKHYANWNKFANTNSRYASIIYKCLLIQQLFC